MSERHQSSDRDRERGGAMVEAPIAVVVIFLLTMGLITIGQMAWTHLVLSSAVNSTTRFASHIEYDPAAGGIDRRRTEAQVMEWAAEVAAEADVAPEDVSVVGRRVPSGETAPIHQLVAGDEIVVTVRTVVSNPLYRLAASITNAASGVVGGGEVFDPDGVGISAGATAYVE